MIWWSVIILFLYSILLLLFILAWRKIPLNSEIQHDGGSNFYSVIIPVRNEEANLGRLLDSILKLQFPKEQFEVIFIDDHSEDNSKEVFNRYVDNDCTLKWVTLGDNEGKKAALKLGIAKASGSVIVTTDGDCEVPPTWLASFDRYYQKKEAKMVFGPVAFHVKNSFFEALQQVEFLALIGSGAASLQLNKPNMCNGANLSFRKEVFYEVNGYEDNLQLASGDDEFLMHAIHQKYPNGVQFSKSLKSLVHTNACSSWKVFFAQRKRWASKWQHYKNKSARRMALFIAIVNFTILLVYYQLLAQPTLLIGGILLLKFFLEGIFIFMIMKRYQKPFKIIHFLLLEICYPIYVVLFGIASNFGAYVWKGRRL